MQILLNELSLEGQFETKKEFYQTLNSLLIKLDIIKELQFEILRINTFYNTYVTSNNTLSNILNSKDNEIRKIKSQLSKLISSPPYWNDDQQHDSTIDYKYQEKPISNTSLAESCERDQMILSFEHKSFLDYDLEIKKNNQSITVYNLSQTDHFLTYLFDKNLIDPLKYCSLRFKDKLSFEYLDKKNGFNQLMEDQLQVFISQFENFCDMSWEEIQQSKGLNYKLYNGDWFKNTDFSCYKIYKFRINQKYRCFGYRSNDHFIILYFELDHKLSDCG